MTESIANQPTDVGRAGPRSRVYQSSEIRQVRARAEFLEQQQSKEEQAGLTRLDRFLSQGRPLNDNAPRGFYLNIRV